MLYFGSFNPIHNGHIALAEYVIEQGLCDMVTLIISPQSPYKLEAEQVAELARFEMAELACQGSKYPNRITPSAIEMLLEKPSYTINTLRYLEEVAGERMEFSILMGGDQIEGLMGWREVEKILEYPIYIYPREGMAPLETIPSQKLTLMADAPTLDISSTRIREAVKNDQPVHELIHPKVAWYIRDHKLYK